MDKENLTAILNAVGATSSLTENDAAFLQQLRRTAKYNRENNDKKAIVTSAGFLSSELLAWFDVDPSAQGAWFFNVYVVFEAMFKEAEAKDWQKA